MRGQKPLLRGDTGLFNVFNGYISTVGDWKVMVLFRLFFISVLLLGLYGCSSLTSNQAARDVRLKAYLGQSEPLVLYTSSSLQSDEQLRLFGMGNQIKPLIQDFPSGAAVQGLVERFIAAVPSLKRSAVRVIESGRWGEIKRSMDTPVLFLHGDWQLAYQRLPPNMRRFRLQAGVIAKIIPLGQVLSGKGTLALKTAAWEGHCLHDALGGEFYSVAEWRNNEERRLRQAINEVQMKCAEKLAREFQGGL